MEYVQLDARAKVNLSLDVINKRDDGYHNIATVMQNINLCDKIVLQNIPSDIQLYSSNRDIPLNSDNIAFKAVELVKSTFNLDYGVRVTITKNIPVAAGLAGGSADAAAVLNGLNRMWGLKLTLSELMKLGVRLGADVPFCITGGTALAEGIGDVITPIDPCRKFWIVLIKPKISVSTAEVYGKLVIEDISEKPDTRGVIKSIKEGNVQELGGKMLNVLEQVTIGMHPEIQRIKKHLLGEKAAGSIMSGSGPSVFGIFGAREEAENAYNSLKNIYKNIYICSTI